MSKSKKLNLLRALIYRVPVKIARQNLELAERHNLDVGYKDLEHHFLAGGDLSELLNGMLFAQKSGIKMSFESASARQLWCAASGVSPFREYLGLFLDKGIRDLDKFDALDPNT